MTVFDLNDNYWQKKPVLNGSVMPDPYGAVVDRTGGGEGVVEYNGLEADEVLSRATANLLNGYGVVLSGRIDRTKPHVPPHKTPWHAGHTGYNGRDIEAGELPGLVRNVIRRLAFGYERGILNLGARLPMGIIGSDVDAYGNKHGLTTLADHEDRLGPLPPTYVVTGRQYETGSGIGLYAVPEDWCGVGELAGGHVELIQRHHRFIVAPGGLHHTGSIYRLYDGRAGTEIPGGWLPARNELPELPQTWLDALYRKPRKPRARGALATSEDVAQFAETYTFDEHPNALTKTVALVRDATGEGWTRNAYHRALFIAARKAGAGCYPWARAVAQIEAAATDAYAKRGRMLDPYDFSRSVEHAVTQALDLTAAELAAWGGEWIPKRSRRFGYRTQHGKFGYRRGRPR